ncbi:MAG: glucose 1-dehydrogenase [Alphaproteobacteria bacterium]|nr:glucose 1-dehydrogenase [Alphaproteobacteria bacterium]
MINADALAGRTILVTGASSGLGAHFARLFVGAGARVALCARRRDRLDTLARSLGPSAAAFAMDVGDEAAIAAAFDAAERALGPIDTLVNNAGMNERAMAVDLAADQFDRVMNVNLRGPFLCAREAARRMMARGEKHGRIVNIASIGALKVLPGLAAYCTSKAGLVMLTKALAREWANRGINVNAVCPGYIVTELNDEFFQEEAGKKLVASFPRRRLMQETDLDDIMAFLCGSSSASVTGAVFTLDDGQTL